MTDGPCQTTVWGFGTTSVPYFRTRSIILKSNFYIVHSKEYLSSILIVRNLVLEYDTDVVPNPQTVVWLGLSELFVHHLTLVCSQTPQSFVEAGRKGNASNIYKISNKLKWNNYTITHYKCRLAIIHQSTKEILILYICIINIIISYAYFVSLVSYNVNIDRCLYACWRFLLGAIFDSKSETQYINKFFNT